MLVSEYKSISINILFIFLLLPILQIHDESMIVDSGDNLDCTEPSKTVLVKIVNKSSVFQSMSEIEKKPIYISVKKLISLLTSYCTQLPVLGYNSSRYDICLVRKQLFAQNELDDDKKHFVIKKYSSYMSISTPTLKFLDASNYLAAGTSYDSFLKSYDTEVRKSYFPYEWLDDYSKLQYSQLPSYDAFYSKLKGVNTLEAEYNLFENLLLKNDGDSEKTLKMMKLNSPPKTGMENYADLLEIWKMNNWTTVKDFFIMYNNCDVAPFVEALLKMLSIYADKKIDLFKNCVTVPGLGPSPDLKPFAEISSLGLFFFLFCVYTRYPVAGKGVKMLRNARGIVQHEPAMFISTCTLHCTHPTP